MLGHIQRGNALRLRPRAGDQALGSYAVQAAAEGKYGNMVALRGTEIVRVPLIEATRELKLVPVERYAEAEVFFG